MTDTTHLSSETASEALSGNTLEKVLGLLGLFTPTRPALTAEKMAAVVGCSMATIYRYVKVLTNAGLLAPAAGGTYVLGARIIELDRQIRLGDPLLAASRDPMVELSRRVGENLLLCSFYGNNVVCIHEEWPDPSYRTSYDRGRPMPLFRGAASKVILANLPPHKLRDLMLKHAEQITSAGLGPNWNAFKSKLRELRKAGYCTAAEEVDPGLAAIAIPLFDGSDQILGSLSITQTLERFKSQPLDKKLALLRETAAKITESLEDQASRFSA
ncbi:conserved hypothetical protein [Mesorhizobium sp. SOD10]|nr:conserved hypothetical protein [Mesorhizobium sp. SOD10]